MDQQINANKLLRDAFIYLSLLLIFVWVLFSYRALISPLIIACLLAYLLNPMVTLLKTKARLQHAFAVYLVFVGFLLSLILFGVYLVPLVLRQATFIAAELQAFPARIGALDTDIEALVGFKLPLQQMMIDLQTSSAQLFHPERMFRVIQSATTNFVWITVILAITFYLLKDWEQIREWFFGIIPEKDRASLRALYEEIKAIWQAYLRGQLVLMTSVGLLSGISAAAMGLRGSVMLGFLAGSLDIIPSFGPVVAAGVAAIIAWTQGSSFLPIPNMWLTVLVVVLYTIIQMIENLFLQPQIMHRRLKLHPAIIFVTVVASLTLVGAVMALIVVPLIGTIGVILQYVRKRRNADSFIHGDGVEPSKSSPGLVGAGDSAAEVEKV